MFWIILLGIATGMRTMTPMAALCWFTWFALIPVTGLSFWTANVISVAVFTALALGEYYADTLPQTPRRTTFFPLLARLVFASLAGALIASALLQPLAGGVIFGAIGAIIGAFGGYYARMYFARRVGRDFPVAVCESALALAFSLLVLDRIATMIAIASRARYPG